MDFQEKNEFVINHKDPKSFEADKALFVQLFPKSRLNADLSRVNSFTREKLDGMMILQLLSKYTADEILTNRENFKRSKNQEERPTSQATGPEDPANASEESETPGIMPQEEAKPSDQSEDLKKQIMAQIQELKEDVGDQIQELQSQIDDKDDVISTLEEKVEKVSKKKGRSKTNFPE